MDDLARRALIGLAKFQLVLAALLFLPAWSLSYRQGWICWALYFICSLVLTLYFLRHEPALVERRMTVGPTAEKETSQKRIQTAASVFVCAVFVVSAVDHNFRWSTLPRSVELAGDALVVIGFAVMFLAFRANAFAAATVAVEAEQKVVSTGLYALVRHPMYSGALLLFVGTPLALGSWFGLVPAACLAATIVWRLIDEEAYLARNLAGYQDYRGKVTSRLVPGLW